MPPLHTVPVLKVDMLAQSCDRCGRGFKGKRKNCHNCGVQVCEGCSSYKTRLPQFGYHKPVRCCTYCSHFVYVYKMDDTALTKLNIKTLKRYLASYNISTHGMLEKQELIKAIQENRPLPDASEIYFRKNTPDTVEKSTMSQEEIYSTASHYQQGSGEGRFWDLDKFFSKLFKNDDSPPKPPQRPDPTPTSPQKPQTVPTPRSQSYQPQPQPQPHPHPHPQPTKHSAGPFDFTQQPQPQCFQPQQQQYGYPPMSSPQSGGNIPHGAMPTPSAAPFTPPTGATPTFFPPGTTPPAQGYYAAYPPGTVPHQNGHSTFYNHTQNQQHPYAQGTQSGFNTTAEQQQAYQQSYQQTYQQTYQTYQKYPPQQGQQQQHPFAQFQPGSPYYEKQPQPQHQQHQNYQYSQQPRPQQQQQQHYTQQPRPAPFPASSASDSGSTNYSSSQFNPQTTYQPKPTPQAASPPKPPTHTPQATPQPMPVPPQAAPRSTSTATPQAVPQPTPQPSRPMSTSRPSTKFPSQEQETPRPQTTPRPTSAYASNSTSSSQSRPVPPTPETPPRGPRAPQDRNDYSDFGSHSGTTPRQSSSSSSHSRQSSTPTSEPRPSPPTHASPPPQPQPTPRPPRQSNRGPQTEHSTSLLTIEEIVSDGVEPSTLSVKVIKSLLDTNCVSYVGVVEKSDLVSQLQKLMISTRAEQERLFNEQEKEKAAAAAAKNWQSEQQQQQQQKQQQQKSSSTATAPPPPTPSANSNDGGSGAADDGNLCKICFEASLNCVMLNCGHMSTCMDCGKKVLDGPRVCPICREYVVKLLHVFRA